ELDGNVAGFAGLNLMGPFTRRGATAGGLHIGQNQQFVARIGEDEIVFDWIAGADLAEVIDRVGKLNFGARTVRRSRGRRGCCWWLVCRLRRDAKGKEG